MYHGKESLGQGNEEVRAKNRYLVAIFAKRVFSRFDSVILFDGKFF